MSKASDSGQQPPPSAPAPDGAPVKRRCSICQMELPDSYKDGQKCPSCGNFGKGVFGVPVEATKGEAAVMHVERLDVASGDVLIFRTPTPPDPRAIDRMFNQVQAHLAKRGIDNVRMMTVPPGVLIEKMTDAELQERGLQRIPK
jgi:hypothetical protein